MYFPVLRSVFYGVSWWLTWQGTYVLLLLHHICIYTQSVNTTMLHFGSENFSLNYRRLSLERPQPRGGLLPQRRFTHLQPLVDMFANLTQVTPSRSDCMVSTTEFSDLKEPETKQTILLLTIVSTAPSRGCEWG